MGKCRYCGKDAGFLSSSHKECSVLAKQSMTYFTNLALHVLRHGGNKVDVQRAFEQATKNANLSPEEREKAALLAIDSSVKSILEDGIVTPQEEANLMTVVNAVNLPISRIHGLPMWNPMIKSLVLADIFSGKVPSRCSSNGDLGVLLQKGESVIWIFNNVRRLETRTRRHYIGGSVGVSVRVMKGVYLRSSSFRGHPVETTETVHTDTGSVIITNKHLFFQGPRGPAKMAAKKILSVEPYTDGITVHLDGVTAKPRTFQGLDGLFAYNIVTNLNLL